MEAIPTRILSEALQEKIASRRVLTAVFTTFRFEPDFFEQEVLPILFNQSFSHAEKVRLLQLEELLRELEHIAVYYDRRGLIPTGDAPVLDVTRIPIARKGYFHPKLIFLLVENDEHDTTSESLILVVTSANLTRAGWWENVECSWIGELADGEQCAFRQDLLAVFSSIRSDERTGDEHPELDRIYKFVRYRLSDARRSKRRGVLRPRMFVGQQPLAEFLDTTLRLPLDTYNLEVISPYFDESDDAGTLRALVETLAPKETRVFLPEADDGSAICREGFFEAVASMPSVRWGRLPTALLRRGKGAEEKQTERFVHAKVYRLWSRVENREFLLIGSANLTRAAHGRANAGNLEASVLLEVEEPGRLAFWLDPMQSPPESFRAEEATDQEEEPEIPPLSVRYRWNEDRAAYFWEDDSPPTELRLSSSGSEVGAMDNVRSGEWVDLPAEAAQRLKALLQSTSFVDVIADGTPCGTILVREEGMSHKPSILFSLTAEEILRYWALLTPEQREAFLESKRYDLLVKRGLAPPRSAEMPVTESMFDRFAGIFHSFAQLEKHVSEALENQRDTVAVYRLFGEKYDSLPHLIDKVVIDERWDPVTQYVTLLTAQHLLRRLEKRHEDFFSGYDADYKRLLDRLSQTDEMRNRLDLAESEDRREFLDWFEKMFLTDAKPLPEPTSP